MKPQQEEKDSVRLSLLALLLTSLVKAITCAKTGKQQRSVPMKRRKTFRKKNDKRLKSEKKKKSHCRVTASSRTTN